MADIELRRQARRRKILENSTNRLKLITGDHNGSINESSKDPIKVEPEKSNDITESFLNLTNHLIENDSRNFITPADISEIRESEETKQIGTTTSTNQLTKITIIILAVITRLLFCVKLQFIVKESIFLPFLVTELTYTYLYEQNYNFECNSFLKTVLLLSNLSPNQIQLFSRSLKVIEHVTADFSLYFISFIVCHILIEFCIS